MTSKYEDSKRDLKCGFSRDRPVDMYELGRKYLGFGYYQDPDSLESYRKLEAAGYNHISSGYLINDADDYEDDL